MKLIPPCITTTCPFWHLFPDGSCDRTTSSLDTIIGDITAPWCTKKRYRKLAKCRVHVSWSPRYRKLRPWWIAKSIEQIGPIFYCLSRRSFRYFSKSSPPSLFSNYNSALIYRILELWSIAMANILRYEDFGTLSMKKMVKCRVYSKSHGEQDSRT